MKALVLPPAAIALTALAGWLLCQAAGWNAHPHGLIAAAIVALLASEAAILPALPAHRSDLAQTMQAALVGMAGHLLAVIVLAGLALVAKVAGPARPFVFWLTAFYWMTLIVVAGTLARMIRAAATGATAGQAHSSEK